MHGAVRVLSRPPLLQLVRHLAHLLETPSEPTIVHNRTVFVFGVIGAGYQNWSMRCNELPTHFHSRSFRPHCCCREGLLDLLLGEISRMFDGAMFIKRNGEVANTCGVNALRVVRHAIRMLSNWLGFLTF